MDDKSSERKIHALNRALMEIFQAETIGGHHVEEAAETLAKCPDASIPHMLKAVRLIVFSISDLLAFNFIEAVSRQAHALAHDDIGKIATTCLDIYERSGLGAAVDFLENLGRTFKGERAGLISLKDEARCFSIFFKGISGVALEFREGPGPTVNGGIFFVPRRLLNFFGDPGLDRRLLRATIFFKAAQVRWHTLVRLLDEAPYILEDRAMGLLYSLLDLSAMMPRIESEFPTIYDELEQMKKTIMERAPVSCPAPMSLPEDDPIAREISVFLCEGPRSDGPFRCVGDMIQETERLRRYWRDGRHDQLFERFVPFTFPVSMGEVIFQREHLVKRLEEHFFGILEALYVKGGNSGEKSSDKVGKTLGPAASAGERIMALINLRKKEGRGQGEKGDAPVSLISMVSDPGERIDTRILDLLDEIYKDYHLDSMPSAIIQSAIGHASHHFDPRISVVDGIQAHRIRGVEGDSRPGVFIYDEWDFRRQGFRAGWCRLKEEALNESMGDFFSKTISRHRATINVLKRQFEALRQATRFKKRQLDGEECDIDAVVEAHADLVSCGRHSQRLFMKLVRDRRDLAVLFLVDMSASTEGWVSKSIKESLIILTQVINATRDPYGIYGFSGMRRTGCRIYRIKGMDEPYGPTVEGRINAIGPRDYTRMGASIRHATAILRGVDARVKLMLIISDGRPEDYDEYKGPYALEDTRHAVFESWRQGIKTFCITIDKEAKGYVPYIFGQYNYLIIPHPTLLMRHMPGIYRRLTSR